MYQELEMEVFEPDSENIDTDMSGQSSQTVTVAIIALVLISSFLAVTLYFFFEFLAHVFIKEA